MPPTDPQKIIITLAQFPPPFWGVSVFFQNTHNLFLKKGVDFIFFNFNHPVDKKNVVNLNFGPLRAIAMSLKRLPQLFSAHRELYRLYGIRLSPTLLIKRFHQAVLISRHLSPTRNYSVLNHHLGFDIFIYLFFP